MKKLINVLLISGFVFLELNAQNTKIELDKKSIQLTYFSFSIILILSFLFYLFIIHRKLKSQNIKLYQLGGFKENLTNMIVHDLKTPLSSIINIRLIKDENTRINMVEQLGYRMLSLVRNILDVHKYENTSLQLNKSKSNLHELVNSALQEVEYHALNKSINVNNKTKANPILKTLLTLNTCEISKIESEVEHLKTDKQNYEIGLKNS